MLLKTKLGAKRNSGRRSDIEVIKLPNTILGIAMLKETLSINILELVVTLIGCSIWEGK